MLALEIKNLVKHYGSFKALDSVSFDIQEGEIFGLIGPNAAGKSTTLKIIATLLTFSSGEISVFGHNLKKEREKARLLVSYLPEEAGAYKNLSGRAYLNFMASFYSKDKEGKKLLVEKAERIAELGDKIKNKVSDYSKGMTRKLLVARALMPEARFTILDELTSGLDVVNAVKVRKIVKDFRNKGMTFLVSSHNMLEVEYLCDRIALIDKGKIIESGTPSDLKEKYSAQNMEEVFEKIAYASQ